VGHAVGNSVSLCYALRWFRNIMFHVGVKPKGPMLVRESQVGFRKVPLTWFGPKLVLTPKRECTVSSRINCICFILRWR